MSVRFPDFTELERARTIKPEERPILTPHEIRMLRRLAESATPGPYHLVTDSCDCRDGSGGCSHGEFPYRMETGGVKDDSLFGVRNATIFDFDDSIASVADGRFLEALSPQTIIALCLLAEDGYEKLEYEETGQEFRAMWGICDELRSFPTHDLLNEIQRRMRGYP